MVLIRPADSKMFSRTAMPMWSFDVGTRLWYGSPLLRDGIVKVANDATGEEVDPEVARRGTTGFGGQAMEFLRERIPELGRGTIVEGRTCHHTNTPDDHFVIDFAPGSNRVLVAGCGTSHGFKVGSSIGPVIADAVEDKDNLLGRLFRLGDRFNKEPRAKDPHETRGFALPEGGTV